MTAVTSSRPTDNRRSAGRYGPRKPNANPRLTSDAGNNTQAGQIRVKAPSAVAILLTRFTPRGQLPNLLCHTTRPALNASSALKLAVNRNSEGRTEGRGAMVGRIFTNTPSSHAKNKPVITSVTPNGIQNRLDCKNRRDEGLFFGARFMGSIVSVVVALQQQKTPSCEGASVSAYGTRLSCDLP